MASTFLSLPLGSQITEGAGVTLTLQIPPIPTGAGITIAAGSIAPIGSLQLGTSAAPWNGLALLNNAYVKARNQANNADITIAGLNTANQVQLGDGTDSGIIIPSKFAKLGSVPAVGAGLPVLVGTTGLLAGQAADLGATNLVAAAPASALYRIMAWIAVTQAATTSSTLPSIVIGFNNGVAQTLALTATNNGNTTTTIAQAVAVIRAASASAITYSTTGYASSGATPMQYEAWVTAEAIQ